MTMPKYCEAEFVNSFVLDMCLVLICSYFLRSRIVRIFRVLQLEDFLVAFSKLDNVFRASKDVLKATGLMAIIIWVGSSAL